MSSDKSRAAPEDSTVALGGSGPGPYRISQSESDLGKGLSVHPESQRSRGCGAPVGAAATACALSVTHLFGLYLRGIFVDVPLATTEGLRAVPRLYGEEVRDYGPIRDWKSGTVVAGKNFAYGLTEGVADLFVQPVQGGLREGPRGVAKGVGKGLLSAGTKIPSGKLRPIQGILTRN
jgi:hypothetical protein